MQHRDLPKKNTDEDDLQFSSYASRVAQGILNYSQPETFILSIEGKWGSGKTTLINFIKNEINASKQNDNYKFIHFNPWLITDINQVVKLFFDELMKMLISISFGVKLKEDIMKDFKKFASLILPDNLKVDVGFMEIEYKPKDTLSLKDEKSLEDIKKSINKHLQTINKRIVIVIDDIDRLTDKETEFIFRLTKGIADFDNLIYILLYDKDVVSKSLEKFKSENGQKYLEKIVQYPLSVPKPHETTIKTLLFKELDRILEKLKSEKVKYIFDQDRWHKVQVIVYKYIKTIRDINQIVNIISFEYPIIAEDVNFIDFFIISLIKLKNHTLYDLIQNKPNDFFIDEHRIYEAEKEKKRIIENFNNKYLQNFGSFKDLLEIIFPIYSEYDYRTSDGHKVKYISNIYYFENYFSFSVSDDKIAMKEYYEIKNLFISSDFEAFEKIILEANKKQKSLYFLDLFKASDEELNKDKIENVFFNSLKIIRKLQDESILFNIKNAYERLAYVVLIKHSKVEEFLLDFYKNDQKVELIIKISLLQKINKEIKDANSNEKLKISDATLQELNDIVKDELESITFDNIDKYNRVLGLINRFNLFNAFASTLKNDINNKIFKSPDNFFKVLKIFKGTSIVNGRDVHHYISKDSLEKFIKLEKIEEYINKLDKSDLTDEEKRLLSYWNENSEPS